ncbi:MAG TPA: hypothetical protein DCO82_09325, partial [Alphaproteobacteria bacterium]|nr:hypothetical protein [Alphaproteobacteria bacterium]
RARARARAVRGLGQPTHRFALFRLPHITALCVKQEIEIMGSELRPNRELYGKSFPLSQRRLAFLLTNLHILLILR